MVSALIRTVFAQETDKEARRQWRVVADQLRTRILRTRKSENEHHSLSQPPSGKIGVRDYVYRSVLQANSRFVFPDRFVLELAPIASGNTIRSIEAVFFI